MDKEALELDEVLVGSSFERVRVCLVDTYILDMHTCLNKDRVQIASKLVRSLQHIG